MRSVFLIGSAMLLAGCWSAGPGQRDPTRYPWDPRSVPVPPPPPPAPHPPLEAVGAIPRSFEIRPQPPLPGQQPPHGTYCIVALDPGATTGITVSGSSNVMTTNCTTIPQAQPPH